MAARKDNIGKKRKQGHIRLVLLRFAWPVGFVGLLCIWIIYCLVGTTVIHADAWNAKAAKVTDRIDTVEAVRGDILACDSTVLATNVATFTLSLDYRVPKLEEDTLRKYAPALGDSLALHFGRRTAKEWTEYLTDPLRIRNKSQRRSYYPLLEGLSPSQVDRVKSWPYFNIKNRYRSGLVTSTVIERIYPYGDMARRSVGRVNRPHRAMEGYSGLEAALDSLLRGQEGYARRVAMTRRIAPWTTTPPRNGCTLLTTIDINMQDVVENVLNEVLRVNHAHWGTAILMEAATGDIKAISNLERADSSRSCEQYIEARNRIVEGVEPGSVIKLVGMIVALENGIATPRSFFHTEHGGYRYKGGNAIKDTHFSPAGGLSLNQVLQYSSNISMTKMLMPAFEAHPNQYREAVRRLGFIDPFHSGLHRETTPYYPYLSDKPQDLRGSQISLSRMTYGYATRIPPLYTCAIYNAVANDGKFVRPRLVKGLRLPDGRDSVIPVSYVNEQMCTPEHARLLQQYLRRVVTEKGGTAPVLKTSLVPIAGKTGTAKIARERPRYSHADSVAGLPAQFKGGYIDGHYRLAFVGMFPADRPQYTCMVLIADPAPGIRSAQHTSGMAVRKIAEGMYARGMLDMPIGTDSLMEQPVRVKASPTLYASRQGGTRQAAQRMGVNTRRSYRSPQGTAVGTVPDVRGMGVREALDVLQQRGYSARVSQAGCITAQVPAPGTHARRGTRITLSTAPQ